MRSPNQVSYLPIPLQRNSNLLQRNSNITAIEFQQLHCLCVPDLFYSWRGLVVDSGKWRFLAGLVAPKFAEIRTYLCGIDFQCRVIGRV
jgi:hypothetical protein